MSLHPQLFAILSGIVEERAGLHYQLADSKMFLDKVGARAAEAGFDSLLDYYYYLRYDDTSGREVDALLDWLVVNETYFCRELAPLEVVLDEFVGPRLAAGERPRIWSAACSTGEEPLTLAMLLAERGWLERVDLVASDISERALERAQSGRFSARSLRGAPPALVGPWLREDGGGIRCDRRLIEAVDWRRLNLLDPAAIAGLGLFDAVVCRNVLIYFADRTVQRVVQNLIGALKPGAPLAVGVSESLLRFRTGLECQERRGSFLYVRPTGEAAGGEAA